MADFSQIQNLQLRVRKSIVNANVLAGGSASAILQRRIYGEGKDFEGKQIGEKLNGPKYSEGYAKKRQKAGRQTRFIDLRFEAKMQNAQQFFADESGFVIGFTNRFDALKMTWLQRLYKTLILWLSDTEQAQINQIFQDELDKELNR